MIKAIQVFSFVVLAGGLLAQEPPEGAAARAEWIGAQVEQVMATTGEERDAVIKSLAEADKDGDCVQPLVAKLSSMERDIPFVLAIVRGLGRDGLVPAALPLAEQLLHKDASVRANAAVSLEYIGCDDKKVIDALRKFAGKEKDEAIANHAWRALGRCGKEVSSVRSLLLKKAAGGKTEFACYGPCIGLAYFVGDEKAARGVEKILKKIGVPGTSGANTNDAIKRSLLSWTLAVIGSKKSATFVRNELMAKLENTKAFWVEPVLTFWDTVAAHIEGPDDEIAAVETGVRGTATFVKNMSRRRKADEKKVLMDDARKEREGFEPTGDNILGSK